MKLSKDQIFDLVVEKNKFLIDQPIFSLRDWLNKCHLSVTDLSLILGVHRSYLHKLMTGTRLPSQNLLDHIKVITNGKVKDIYDLIDTF
jgi:hypothetical protein